MYTNMNNSMCSKPLTHVIYIHIYIKKKSPKPTENKK